MATTYRRTCGYGTWPSPFTFFDNSGHNGIVNMGHYSHSPSPCFSTLGMWWYCVRWFANHETLPSTSGSQNCGNGTWPSLFTFFADIGHNGIEKIYHSLNSASPCFSTLGTRWHRERWFTNHTTLLDHERPYKPKLTSLPPFSIPSSPIYDNHLRLKHPPPTNIISTRRTQDPSSYSSDSTFNMFHQELNKLKAARLESNKRPLDDDTPSLQRHEKRKAYVVRFSNTITVLVGDERTPFMLHKDKICAQSNF
jgi:hypothetical protein